MNRGLELLCTVLFALGAGVVGEEPVLEPGASYEYTSGVPLPTPSGIMVGTYGMVTTDGERFDIDGLHVEILEAERRRIHKVRVHKLTAELEVHPS
jgi:hypothetical protein